MASDDNLSDTSIYEVSKFEEYEADQENLEPNHIESSDNIGEIVNLNDRKLKLELLGNK